MEKKRNRSLINNSQMSNLSKTRSKSALKHSNSGSKTNQVLAKPISVNLGKQKLKKKKQKSDEVKKVKKLSYLSSNITPSSVVRMNSRTNNNSNKNKSN